MKIEIKVPAMGESISEATIGEVFANSGSSVEADSEILELETDKVNQVLYAPQAGQFSLNVKPGDSVKIGQVIGTIDTEAKAKAKTEKVETELAKNVNGTNRPSTSLTIPAKNSAKVETKRAMPTRKTKDSFFNELKQPQDLRASGSTHVKQPAPLPSQPSKSEESQKSAPTGTRETRRKMSKIRKLIANRLVEVGQTTAMLTTFNEVDMTAIMQLRERYKEGFTKKYGVKLGLMPFFVKASVSALHTFPDVNSYIEGDDIVHREYYDIGIAVGTEKGLIVPVVRDCDLLSFAGIEKSIEEYAHKAKDGTLAVDDLQGGGFTITNGGVYGSLLSTPILNPPQCAILGMHKIEKRAVVIDDQIVIRQMMYLALSYDHRLIDGKEAVSFLIHIKNVLEDPSRMFLEI